MKTSKQDEHEDKRGYFGGLQFESIKTVDHLAFDSTWSSGKFTWKKHGNLPVLSRDNVATWTTTWTCPKITLKDEKIA